MSGPKGIQYEIALERRRAEDAMQKWRALNGRVQAFSLRCSALNMSDASVLPGAVPAGTSAAIEAACAELERTLASAHTRLESQLSAQRSQRITHNLDAILEELDQRESAASVLAEDVRPKSSHNVLEDAEKVDIGTKSDIADRVRRVLSSLVEQSDELETMAAGVLRAPPARARLLLSDLSSRVNAANRRSQQRIDNRGQIEEIRCEAALLLDRSRIDMLLDGADHALESHLDPTPSLTSARATLAMQSALEREERDQAFVLGVVTESLVELGYSVSPIDLETPSSAVFKRSGPQTHAVTANVSDGEIGLRTVRTTAATDRGDDLAAEQQMCSDLDPLIEAMRARGVMPGRVRAVPAGVTTPKLITSTIAAPATAKPAHVGTRRTRENERTRE